MIIARPAVRVYQLKVTLLDTRPPVWRRFQICGDATFTQLHRVLQVVMGWRDCHLHQFSRGQLCIGIPDTDSAQWEQQVLNGNETRVGDVLRHENTPLTYEYDCGGDGWAHQLIVEKILPGDPAQQYPICLDGAMACPPEDSGGPIGYSEKLQIMQDPLHPEFDDITAWMPAHFDPKAFFLPAINAQLRRIK